ncbi:3-hydroxyacyl-CoA dehydrogenase family protein [Pseudomonas sp. NPDC007930]|uniref:3-hydroxyacyl-CoA dehydrogenase family protein n=1 Tax=Pseudomonas sp. NPDC007930 TaxID=3364417 RepID=UPI0036F092C3
MSHTLVRAGASRSFAADHPLCQAATTHAEVLLILGSEAGQAYAELAEPGCFALILIELGDECLGVHTGEQRGEEGSQVLGFARFRLGHGAPSDLVEIVRQPATPAAAIAQARGLFEAHGLLTAVCADFPGRIVNRLVRPYYNAALAKLDAGLASAADLDLTLKLGLGYPEGPIELLERTGLAEHCDTTEALYQALAEPAYAPARRARVARQRRDGA